MVTKRSRKLRPAAAVGLRRRQVGKPMLAVHWAVGATGLQMPCDPSQRPVEPADP
jgi:hypothetical protein